ncbi:biliverdin-producing heme oxygenase [Wenyingzhuangia sp. IMCC45533]
MNTEIRALSERLKQATKDLHAKAETKLNAHTLMSKDLGIDQYKSHLITLFKSHKKIDLALSHYNQNALLASFLPIEPYTDLLSQDLMSMNALPTTTQVKSNINFESTYQALGALYVINGSTLGRRYIAKSIANKLSEWQFTSHFYNQDTIKELKWADYKNRLDALELSETQQEDVIVGAQKCFMFFME